MESLLEDTQNIYDWVKLVNLEIRWFFWRADVGPVQNLLSWMLGILTRLFAQFIQSPLELNMLQNFPQNCITISCNIICILKNFTNKNAQKFAIGKKDLSYVLLLQNLVKMDNPWNTYYMGFSDCRDLVNSLISMRSVF